MRRANEELIHELASKVTDTMISEWKIRTFYPLKNGKKVADFGDHRHYYYKSRDNKVSELIPSGA